MADPKRELAPRPSPPAGVLGGLVSLASSFLAQRFGVSPLASGIGQFAQALLGLGVTRARGLTEGYRLPGESEAEAAQHLLAAGADPLLTETVMDAFRAATDAFAPELAPRIGRALRHLADERAPRSPQTRGLLRLLGELTPDEAIELGRVVRPGRVECSTRRLRDLTLRHEQAEADAEDAGAVRMSEAVASRLGRALQ